MRLTKVVSICLLGTLWVGCGGSDKKGGGGSSFADISDGIAHPTGTLAADNAKGVADAFSQAQLGGAAPTAGGERIAASSTYSYNCPNGGSIDISGSSSGSTTNVSFTINDCCYSAGCCEDGSGHEYFSTSSTGTATYSGCFNYNVDLTCEGSYSLDYSYCLGANGMLTYLIEFQGESFAVSGSYSNGNGTLTITGANGTYTCTYTNNTGTCTGDSGNFSF